MTQSKNSRTDRPAVRKNNSEIRSQTKTTKTQNQGKRNHNAKYHGVSKALRNQTSTNQDSQNFNRTLKLTEPVTSTHVAPLIKHHYSEAHHEHSHGHSKRSSAKHFKEELEECIHNMEGKMHSYANTLLYPEVSMSRIPFLCPVPTALCRGVSINSYTIDPTAGDTFAWSFIPEALVKSTSGATHHPFYYTMANNPDDNITCSNYVTAPDLMPNIAFGSMAGARIVGASVIVTQTQRLVDRCGFAFQSRIYGLNGFADGVSKNAVMNAVYKEQVNFSTGENVHLRNIYAPADFTDLQLQVKNANEKDPDTETHPVIQGFFTGFADSTAAIQSPITLTFEFNVVFEYTPVPALYQMVERKSAVVNQMKVQKAENAVSKLDTGLDPDSLSRMVAISRADPTTLRQIGYS